MFHPECLDIHASSMAPTAPAESFCCSVCKVSYHALRTYTHILFWSSNNFQRFFFVRCFGFLWTNKAPVIPTTNESNALINELLRHLRSIPWAASRLGAAGGTNVAGSSATSSTSTSSQQQQQQQQKSSVFVVPSSTHSPMHGIVSRKASAAAANTTNDTEEEDKYQRRDGVQRLMNASPLSTTTHT